MFLGESTSAPLPLPQFAVEFPTFGEVAGVSTSVQWINLVLGKPFLRLWYFSSQVSMCSVMSKSMQRHGLYIACQVPLSMGFSRQEDWSWLPLLSPWDLPRPDRTQVSCVSCIAGGILYRRATWEALQGSIVVGYFTCKFEQENPWHSLHWKTFKQHSYFSLQGEKWGRHVMKYLQIT